MGMFNSIIADLPCVANKVTARGEIQIKWQSPEMRSGEAYYLGEVLDGIMAEYDNVRVKKDFVCEACSIRTLARGCLRKQNRLLAHCG